jgi:hypothetical protein
LLALLQKCEPGTTVVIDEVKARFKKGDIVKMGSTLAFNLY